jgi:TolA-binding protein
MASTLTAQPHVPASATNRSLAWVQSNRKLLMIIGGALVVLIVGIWFISTAKSRREDFAARSLSQARNLADAGNLPEASAQFQRIIDTYAGTDAAQEAEIAINQYRLASGQNELAVVRLREYVASNPSPRYIAAANGLLGAALENVGRPAEAAEAYKRASEVSSVDYLKAEYLIQAGRAYVAAGKTADAETAYRAIIDQYAETGPFVEAQVRLAELTKGQL